MRPADDTSLTGQFMVVSEHDKIVSTVPPFLERLDVAVAFRKPYFF
ncbi:unnamed protein product [Gongylonema pulchrum]|uniref:Uncharacterized protein n=1 Tax=Gongylonema pulchrum TaxID=637853 RepID=A0A3P6TAU9_9BILA|nr:unnamed protein product [Gongylonema pulchrum]